MGTFSNGHRNGKKTTKTKWRPVFSYHAAYSVNIIALFLSLFLTIFSLSILSLIHPLIFSLLSPFFTLFSPHIMPLIQV